MARDPDYLIDRNGIFYYVRRVPSDVRPFVDSDFVRRSTKKRTRREARPIAERFNREAEAHWRRLAAGEGGSESQQRYEEAIIRARAMGLGYQTADQIAAGPLEDLVKRLEIIEARGSADDEAEVAAVLGGVDVPDFTLTEARDEFFKIARDRLSTKAVDQVRKWKNPRIKAVANLVRVVGNKKLSTLTRADALDFRAWWADRVEVEGVQIETANKDIGHLNGMLRELDERYRLGLDAPFDRMRLRGGTTGQRTAFDPDFVQTRILAPDALSALNAEARGVIWLMASTGLRVSEAVNLASADIALDHDVPHIIVQAGARQLKTRHSERTIPLFGSSLAAMTAHGEGFPRYRGKADALSALVNKALDNAGLRPTKGHTLYSLRHTFQDRMIAAEVPERIQAELMGHKLQRPRYGKGPSLEQKLEWIERVAFVPTA